MTSIFLLNPVLPGDERSAGAPLTVSMENLSTVPALRPWWDFLGTLGLGVAILILLTLVLGRLCRRATARRTAWRLGFVAVACLVVLEATGVAGAVAATLASWLAPPPPSGPWPGEPTRWLRYQGKAALPGIALWPALAWLSVAAVLLGRLVVVQCLLLRLGRRIRTSSSTALLERVNRLRGSLRCRQVRVGILPELNGPIVFGLRQPVLALPLYFEEDFADGQQDAILAHELGHVGSSDPAWQLFAEAIVACLWWHPLVWWARKRLRYESESAADEASLIVRDGPGLLAESLILLGKRLLSPTMAGAFSILDRGFRSPLGRRVQNLLQLEGAPPAANISWRRRGLAGLLTTGVLLVAISSTVWLRPRSAAASVMPLASHWQQSLLGQTLARSWSPAIEHDPDAAWELYEATPQRSTSSTSPARARLALPVGGMLAAPIEPGPSRVPMRSQEPVRAPLSRNPSAAKSAVAPSQVVRLHQVAAPEPRSEEEIIGRLGLTADQLQRFRTLHADLKVETQRLYNLKSGHVERGLEINRTWRAGLQAIFTPDQYRRYCAYWEAPRPVVQ